MRPARRAGAGRMPGEQSEDREAVRSSTPVDDQSSKRELNPPRQFGRLEPQPLGHWSRTTVNGYR